LYFVEEPGDYSNTIIVSCRVDSGVVAFAHGKDEGSSHNIGASFFDLTGGRSSSVRDSWSGSEPLCLKFQKNNGKNNVLFGHRDGSVSVIDTRSRRDALFSTEADEPQSTSSFGSATCVRTLRDERWAIAKGSFGSCRIFDLRCMSNEKNDARNNIVKSSSSRYRQPSALLSELRAPSSMIHPTRSIRCTGLAMDPAESVVVAPFAGSRNGNHGTGDVHFAIWDLSSGALLRTMNVNEMIGNGRRRSLDDAGGMGYGGAAPEPSSFCELSSVATPGYEMLFGKDSTDEDDDVDAAPVISHGGSSFGLWFKTNALLSCESSLLRPDCGGIHHIRF